MYGYLKVFLAVFELCDNWLAILGNRLLGWRLAEIRMRNGVRFALVKNTLGKADLSMFAEIWHHEYYTPPFFDIGPQDTVFDIGANNGYFTVFAAKKATRGRVVAFEPVPRLSEIVKANIAVNRLTNATVEPLAIADKDGSHEFFISVSHNGCHSLFKRGLADQSIKVKTSTLEHYCETQSIDRINFLKLDCEGAEYEILLTMGSEMLDRIDKIAMEFHDDITNHTHEELADFLSANGFYVSVRGGYLYALGMKYLALCKRGNVL